MTPSDRIASVQMEHWAARQLADYDARTPGSLFAEGLVLNVPQAYALQVAVTELRRRRGERMIGYKVGCTSPKIRAQLKIDHCVTGRLYDSEQHTSGAVLSRGRFANLAIEGELAVELARPPKTSDFSDGALPMCVARVMPVIELHHHVLRSARSSAAELIAHNAIHAGFVVGTGVTRADVPREPQLAIFVNDQRTDSCAGAILIDTISSSLRWLMEVVDDRGEQLEAGQIVLTGSIPSLIPLAADCRVRVDSGALGHVDAEFTA